MLYSVLLTKLRRLGILFSKQLRVVLVAKLVMSGILSSIFFILALYIFFTNFFMLLTH